MTTTIRLEGSKEVQAALRRMSQDVRDEVGKAVVGTAIELRTDVIDSLNQPGSGRVYQKYNPRRSHQASAPGQAPATDTGRLINSIKFDRVGDLTATVGSRLVYATWLEYGASRMAARPFFRPAVERMRAKFQSRIEKAISGATR